MVGFEGSTSSFALTESFHLTTTLPMRLPIVVQHSKATLTHTPNTALDRQMAADVSGHGSLRRGQLHLHRAQPPRGHQAHVQGGGTVIPDAQTR